MDDVYSNLLEGKISGKIFENKLSKILSNIELGKKPKKFTVFIIPTDKKVPFFGMRIFPSINEMNNILKKMVVDKESFKDLSSDWRDIEEWYMEIDSNIFNPVDINFTPKELTAMTLHELGHVIYSDKVIEKFYRAYINNYIKLNLADKSSIKILYMLYGIPLTVACRLRNWINGKNEIKIEYYSDTALTKYGYKEDLLSALNKIVKHYGSTVASSDNNKDDLNEAMNWANINIADLNKRRDNLKNRLFLENIKTNSKVIKMMSLKIINDFGIKLRETYTGAVLECSQDIINNPNFFNTYDSFYSNNSLGNIIKIMQYTQKKDQEVLAKESSDYMGMINRFSELEDSIRAIEHEEYITKIAVENSTPLDDDFKVVTQLDVDLLSRDVDNMENPNDKKYVLELLYSTIQKVDEFKDLIEINDTARNKWATKLDHLTLQLNEIRKRILNTHDFGTDMIFIKYGKEV